MTPQIQLRGISKRFVVTDHSSAALAWALRFIGASSSNATYQHEALSDVSVTVHSGDTIALIGRNGSGKSTLLKVIGDILRPDSGEMTVSGHAMYVSGFGKGLNPQLTMRENIHLLGVLMGMERTGVQTQFDDIVSFSGLAPHLDTKVGTFSTGMITRLNFSVGIHALEHLSPDILLLDEIFGGGGDIAFKNAAQAKIQSLLATDQTVIAATHEPKQMAAQCDRAVWLEDGHVKAIGDPQHVTDQYVRASA